VLSIRQKFTFCDIIYNFYSYLIYDCDRISGAGVRLGSFSTR